MDQIINLLDKLHLEDLKNEIHPSIFDSTEDYKMLIIRIPIIEESLTTKSLGFILTEEKSYFYNRELGALEELNKHFMSIHSIIDKITDKLLKAFIEYQEKIVDMEEQLYANDTNSNFLNEWLSIKLDILRIERVLLRTTNTVRQFSNFYKESENFPSNSYSDIYEHMERAMRSATLQLSKLDYLYSFYNAKTNDRMNKMIYILTIISAIFLPLNLMVGFFGMNTTFLPFSEGSYGTIKATLLMASIALLSAFLFYYWKKRFTKKYS